MQLSKSLLCLPVLALILVNLGGCGGGSASHSTPEAAFTAFQDAAKKEDWKTFSDCLTEESRDQMAAGLAMSTITMNAMSKMAGDKLPAEMKDTLEKTGAILKKHGLTEEKTKELEKEKVKGKEGLKKIVEPIQDKAAFIADMMKVMKKKSDKVDPDEFNAKLKDVKIDGNSAKGTIVQVSQGKEKSEPIEFRQENGSWRVQLPGMDAGPMEE